MEKIAKEITTIINQSWGRKPPQQKDLTIKKIELTFLILSIEKKLEKI